jgi:putative hydrolase
MHTTYTDGTASILEMAEAALSREIGEVLFSEHVRHTSTYYPTFASEVDQIRHLNLKIRLGVETKVLNLAGDLDCPPHVASLCDAIVGTVHSPPADLGNKDGSWSKMDEQSALALEFDLAMAIVSKSRAHILGHPLGMVISKFKLSPTEKLYELAYACREHDKAFELNPRYCHDVAELLEIVERAKCKVSFGSDAHRSVDVGVAWDRFVVQQGR